MTSYDARRVLRKRIAQAWGHERGEERLQHSWNRDNTVYDLLKHWFSCFAAFSIKKGMRVAFGFHSLLFQDHRHHKLNRTGKMRTLFLLVAFSGKTFSYTFSFDAHFHFRFVLN